MSTTELDDEVDAYDAALCIAYNYAKQTEGESI